MLQAHFKSMNQRLRQLEERVDQDSVTIEELKLALNTLESEILRLRAKSDLDQQTIRQLQERVNQLQEIRPAFPPTGPDGGRVPHA
ncbi:hypothetical protein QR90_08580 [Deinococcus radiopugnans]|uniref:Uncharacterized protein n=1 Tax=Deinococcus radiopugnans TaxID=57497 RepID=A0A0A7KGB5_9DEIO|nr:hypothetical protein QR90_08580 [Deinococcus radiopugnans]